MLRRHAFVIVSIVMWSGCDPETPAAVDAMYTSPIIDSLVLSQTVIDTDTILVGDDRLPEDELPISIQASARLALSLAPIQFSARVSKSDGRAISSSSSFNDDGIAPDLTGSDGIYTGNITFTLLRSLTGTVGVSVVAISERDLVSNTLSASVSIIRANLPPLLSSLEADTLVSQSGGNSTLQLRITATDPNGNDDVRRVWFDSFRPDGSPSSGNPFFLFDDGNAGGISGDLVAQDGIYGLTVAFQGASPGTYRFEFRATDRSGDTSNVIPHLLTVIP